MKKNIYTIGHSTITLKELIELLQLHEIKIRLLTHKGSGLLETAATIKAAPANDISLRKLTNEP